MVLLGDGVSLRDSCAKATTRHDRVRDISGRIAQSLPTNCLTPAAACNLGGDLFLHVTFEGANGAIDDVPFFTSPLKNRVTKLANDLDRILTCRYSEIGRLRRRCNPFVEKVPFGGHTDAQGAATSTRRTMAQRRLLRRYAFRGGFAPWGESDGVASPVYLCGILAATLSIFIANERDGRWPRTGVLALTTRQPRHP